MHEPTFAELNAAVGNLISASSNANIAKDDAAFVKAQKVVDLVYAKLSADQKD